MGAAGWWSAAPAQGSPAASAPLASDSLAIPSLGRLDRHARLRDIPADSLPSDESAADAELRWLPELRAAQGAGIEANAADDSTAKATLAEEPSEPQPSAEGELSFAPARARRKRPASSAAEASAAESGAAESSAAESSAAEPSDENQALREKVRSVLDFYRGRMLNARENNCWELMHAIVAFGVESNVRRGATKGSAVNSIAWLCSGAECAGRPLVYLDHGRLTAAKGPYVQGHHGQFLAILAQSKVMPDYPILVGKRSFTVEDLIETEKLSCFSKTELTFKLISLAHYLDSDARWKNSKGEVWSIERLIREEIDAPINGAPCGGTHRLMGLSYAVHERLKQGQPVDGEFLRAQTYVDDYHRYTFRLQNPDGSFSTDWFKGRAAKPDLDRRLQTTGHILEWLAYSVPDETLDDPRFIKSVAYLAGILDADRKREWSVGPLGHGLHALALYEERMQRLDEREPRENIARREVRPRDEIPALEYSPAAEASQPVIVPIAPRRGGGLRLGNPRSGENFEEDRE
jgi:hypothetical protein